MYIYKKAWKYGVTVFGIARLSKSAKYWYYSRKKYPESHKYGNKFGGDHCADVANIFVVINDLD